MPRPIPQYDAVLSFRGPHEFLGNFYARPIVVGPKHVKLVGNPWTFPSVENAYQALKSSDLRDWRPFQTCSPAAAKKMGYAVRLRPDWEELKVPLMLCLLRCKFEDSFCRGLLRATGNAILIEGNDWNDPFWGYDIKKGVGQNMLGQLLMKVRAEL
jgi:ribA/ribD-fused uncharacterized protein